MPLRDTWKYGTLVPSFDVAKCWLTSRPDASKNDGISFNFSGAWPIRPYCSVAGAR